MTEQVETTPQTEKLTDFELEILRRQIQGRSVATIIEELSIVDPTISMSSIRRTEEGISEKIRTVTNGDSIDAFNKFIFALSTKQLQISDAIPADFDKAALSLTQSQEIVLLMAIKLGE